jgi:glycosyltransferase involved in cell wall biosynthesis
MLHGPFINVLIRTSNRPNSFKRCLNSLFYQSYQNFRILVSADDDLTQRYVAKSIKDNNYFNNIDLFRVEKKPQYKPTQAPYNLYLNTLMYEVLEGWVIILDDDDYLINDQVLKKLAGYFVDDDCLYIWKMKRGRGSYIPDKKYFGKLHYPNKFIEGHIGMPCFGFHITHFGKDTEFANIKGGDVRVIRSLYDKIGRLFWINEAFIQIGNHGLHGKPVDIKKPYKYDFFYKVEQTLHI